MYATIRLIKQNDTIQVDVIDNNYLTALELMKERTDGESIGFFIENIEEHEAVKRTLNAIACGTANFLGDSIGYVDSEFQVFMTPEPAYGIEVLKPKRENGGFKTPEVYEPSDQIFHDVPSHRRSDKLVNLINHAIEVVNTGNDPASVLTNQTVEAHKAVVAEKNQKNKEARKVRKQRSDDITTQTYEPRIIKNKKRVSGKPVITKDNSGKIIKITTRTFSIVEEPPKHITSGNPF